MVCQDTCSHLSGHCNGLSGRHVMSSIACTAEDPPCRGGRYTLNMSRLKRRPRWCDAKVRERVGQLKVSSSSLDHGSKLRGPSTKAFE
ncbi:hypothetical protein TNCV_458001 [Trichonephila clavipes]|nr:hypothetical protein TNCV_458001 [Trichonephila clavipes]